MTAQWYFKFFFVHIFNVDAEVRNFFIPTASDPNCQQLYENILAGEKDDYGIVRIEPYQTNEEIEAWRWSHLRVLQNCYIFEAVHNAVSGGEYIGGLIWNG